MNKLHKQVLVDIESYKRKPKKYGDRNYLGTKSQQYHLTNPQKWQIAKKWAKGNRGVSLKDFVDLLTSLNSGRSHEEKTLVGMILYLFPKFRSQLAPEVVEKWLGNLNGWSEVDNLCQNNFCYQDFFANWRNWQKVLRDFSTDENVHLRRASLVLLTGPVNYCPDKRLSDLAFENLGRLKAEKDVLITKAASWLLRALIKNHREEVEKYIRENEASLPKIAVRETRNKLKSGRKSGH